MTQLQNLSQRYFRRIQENLLQVIQEKSARIKIQSSPKLRVIYISDSATQRNEAILEQHQSVFTINCFSIMIIMKDQRNLSIYFYGKFIWDTYIYTYLCSINSSRICRYNSFCRNNYFFPIPKSLLAFSRSYIWFAFFLYNRKQTIMDTQSLFQALKS